MNPAQAQGDGRGLLEGGDTTVILIAGLLGIALVLGTALVLTRALLRAAQLPPPTALILALSMLTLLAIAGGLATDNDEAWTIAAAGIGALAGSVTALFQTPPPPDEEKPDV